MLFNIVGDVRGIGLMQALELVSDRDKKTPMDKGRMNTFLEAVYQGGVLVRVSGNNVILSPPLVIDANHVSKIIAALEAGLSAIQ